ncbi:hypothetical protein GGR95_000670 [Sulfitobacter undariae]|uniref:Uncharacterized protein n=1 Tax=Sulfitobacter undariae TaxID=1563671 RepID=A0A7W6E1L3_9RHOB|nr:hypothetical protein [Sulfitobacter undariae]MBB3993051.1 hypothetical protein [Sulfitobacter undariae]
MSKVVTNEEVEDVLSSIRRLVSEGKRPLAGVVSQPQEPVAMQVSAPEPAAELTTSQDVPEAADVAAAVDEPPSSRLVLTPALRVVDVPDQSAASDEGPLDLGSVGTKITTDTDVAGDTPASHTLDDNLAEVSRVKVNPNLHGAMPYSDATPEVSQQGVDSGDDGDWADEIAIDDLPQSEAPPTIVLDAKAVPDLNLGVAEQDANFLTADVPLTAKIAALGAAMGKSTENWEPDGDEANELAAEKTPTMAWEEDAEFDAKGTPLQSPPVETVADHDETFADHYEDAHEPLEQAASKPGLGSDDQLLDEDALRELVSEIVREELQGALGERITRNVRKLVRREIHRALTAQEME